MTILERRDPEALLARGPVNSAPPNSGALNSGALADLQCTAILGLFVALPTAAWVQHVYACVVSGSWGFLIGGTLFLPAGIVHGIGCWLGFWS